MELDLPGFRGPLQQLLRQAEGGGIDIASLSLAEVARQWWEMAGQQGAGPEELADFMAAMARLLELKAQALLPRPQAPSEAEEERTGPTERWPFLEEAARILEAWEEQGRRAYPRPRPPRGLPLPPGLEGVTLDQLARLVQEALEARPEDSTPFVPQEEAARLEEKVAHLRQAVAASRGPLTFRRLLAECRTRREVIVLFLALLELIKRGEVWAHQDSPFGEIVLVAAS